jgi:chromosome partitioning protein
VLLDALNEAKLDHVFSDIDCSPSLSILTVNALVSSNYILIPIQTHYYAMEGMKQLFSTIDIVKRRINRDLKVLGILPTFLDRRTNISKEVLDGVREFFKERVFQTAIHSNVKLTEAPSAGEPVTVYDPNSSGANDYRALAKEILERLAGFDNPTQEQAPSMSGQVG